MAIETKEEYWSRFQTTFDQNQAYVVGKEHLDDVKESVKSLSDLGEVLELGCGTGCFTEAIALNADHVFATDLSDELLENARKRTEKVDNITVQKENCISTSFTSKNLMLFLWLI